jgi:hypothetical protein
VLEDARSAGADVRDAAERDWGGYLLPPTPRRPLEIAYNPGEIGQSVLPGR